MASALAVATADCSLAHGPNADGLCEWCGRPVPAGLEVWCSGACTVAFNEAHQWPLARAAALARAARRCHDCPPDAPRRRVEVHHDPPVPPGHGYEPGCQHHADRLIVVCRPHHDHRHSVLRARPGAQLALFRAA